MRFLVPNLFYFWAALVVIPIALYLFRPRPKTVKTSTLPFFKWLAREHQDSTWLKRLKYLLSLLFCLLFITCIAAALGQLVIAPDAQDVKTVVVLFDRSASMSAQEGESSRLDAAKEAALNRLAGVPSGVGVVVIGYDQRPEVLLSRSFDARQINRAVSQIDVRPVEGDPTVSFALAEQLAELETPAAIWHVSDQPAEFVSESDEIAVEQIRISNSDSTNVGITALKLRRLPLEPAKFEVFVQVHATGSEDQTTKIDVFLDGEHVGVRNLTIAPQEHETLLIPVTSSTDSDRQMMLKASTTGDVFATDDIAIARIPKHKPLKVLWVSESHDPFTELALRTLGADGALEILHGNPEVWPPEDTMDVLLLDNWLPDKWPEQASVIIMNPPNSLGPLQAARVENGIPLESVRATNKDHPLLFGVASDRVAVTQTAIVDGSGLLQPLWVGEQGPALLAGESAGQRVAVLPFNVEMSEQLALLASYPLLVGNAIYWTSQPLLEKSGGMNRQTGEIIECEAESIQWRAADAEATPQTEQISERSYELERVGFWETSDGLKGSSSLLSAKETLLADADTEEKDNADSTVQASLISGDLRPLLLWLVLIGLITESWLYHKYFVF